MHLAGVTLEWFQKGPLLSHERGGPFCMYLCFDAGVYACRVGHYTKALSDGITRYLSHIFSVKCGQSPH